MTEGDVVLTPVTQADGQIKNRPAIFLREMPPFGDLLVCGISTQLHRHVVDFDEVVATADDDAAIREFGVSTGLVRESSCDGCPKDTSAEGLQHRNSFRWAYAARGRE